MIRILGLLVIGLLMAASLPFCKKDPVNCKDELVGEVYLSAETEQFFPEMNTDVVTFENANGTTRNYSVTKREERIKLNVEKLCESFNLSTHYRYMHGDLISYTLRGVSDSILIDLTQVSCALNGKKDTCFFDHLSVLRLEQMAGAECFRIVSYRGRAASEIPQTYRDNQGARFVGDTTLQGVPYQQVYAGRLIGGSTVGSPQNVFVAQGHGLVAFVDESGILWRKKD